MASGINNARNILKFIVLNATCLAGDLQDDVDSQLDGAKTKRSQFVLSILQTNYGCCCFRDVKTLAIIAVYRNDTRAIVELKAYIQIWVPPNG